MKKLLDKTPVVVTFESLSTVSYSPSTPQREQNYELPDNEKV